MDPRHVVMDDLCTGCELKEYEVIAEYFHDDKKALQFLMHHQALIKAILCPRPRCDELNIQLNIHGFLQRKSIRTESIVHSVFRILTVVCTLPLL